MIDARFASHGSTNGMLFTLANVDGAERNKADPNVTQRRPYGLTFPIVILILIVVSSTQKI